MSSIVPQTSDFFISYSGADRAWAEWIAYQLEAALTEFPALFQGKIIEDLSAAADETITSTALVKSIRVAPLAFDRVGFDINHDSRVNPVPAAR